MEVLEIKKEELISNINTIKKLTKSDDTKIIAVIKGNGYGLGLVEYAKILIEQQINFLAVATLDEAIQLRSAGIEQDILMMSSTCVEEDVEKLVDNNIILTLGSELSVEVAKKIAKKDKKTLRAHLKIDTGFGRYGFIYSDVQKIISSIQNLENIKIEGTFSHFSNSYEKSKIWTEKQFNRFLEVVNELKQNNINTGTLHIANSSAFLKYPYMHLDAVRVGSAFLGRIADENVYGLKKIRSIKK